MVTTKRWILLLTLFFSGINGIVLANETPAQILANAVKISQNTSFSAQRIASTLSGSKIMADYYQRITPDGIREEKFVSQGGARWFLTNTDGNYMILGKNAIKTPNSFSTSAVEVLNSKFANKEKVEYEYTIENGNVDGQDCYIIARKIKNPQELRGLFDEILSTSGIKADQEQLMKFVHCTTVFIINKENSFIIATKFFGADKKLLSEVEYKNINFKPHYDDAFFTIPADVSIAVANNENELSALTVKAIKAAHSKSNNRVNVPNQSKEWIIYGICGAVLLLMFFVSVRVVRRKKK